MTDFQKTAKAYNAKIRKEIKVIQGGVVEKKGNKNAWLIKQLENYKPTNS